MSQSSPRYGLAPPLHEVRRRRWRFPWIFFLVAALLVAVAVPWGVRGTSALTESIGRHHEPAPPGLAVAFEVTGVGKVFSITATAGSSVRTEADVTLPWTYSADVSLDRPATVKLVVVGGPDGNEVHGRYTVDGSTVRAGSASGPYGVLTITDS
ncbi:hypothetical protein [Lentzea sp. NPDC059081]|uniref:hypothetical protein n=1 Tax=Lentzea sp. NPDC059081 TaxID=3346719 RepID=UPI0036BBBA37